ncbi:hypothetical protein NECAME_12119 [Necator americanus]|uniref:Reverse transcriptase domain-containing protein n=1 Tax=Necator americanus TaxID=51031 RepID=W2T1E7_NECAM|nr:hypothetical protein NECAME_12119 [Necator americanus]ETN75810.1 hypothetical protein NECAME_12119 [Necator americanus]
MKSNKATGPDDVTADVWKLLGDRMSVWFATLFNKIVAEGRTLDVWQTSVTVPVWKGKGDTADCTSYRPIRLLCHTMKVLERVLDARLRKIVSVSLNQCGFVKDCSTIDAIHAVRILLEKHREKNRRICAVDEAALCEAYQHCTMCCWNKQAIPCTSRGSSGFIPLTPAVHTVHEHDNEGNLEAANLEAWTLLFADDVMLASESRGDFQKQVNSWEDRLQKYGLRLSISKTEYMECGPRMENGSIRVDGTELKKVPENMRKKGS